ncbi:MAG: HIT family protein [Rhodobacteraceae bacterium]|nr:HIT family protein [Paracoccaceae bacterium]
MRKASRLCAAAKASLKACITVGPRSSSKRHVVDYFELFQPELNAINRMVQAQRERLLDGDASVEGFNVGVNSGEIAGQTVFHCHVHLIPRRRGDVENPRGGVRGVVPEKQSY